MRRESLVRGAAVAGALAGGHLLTACGSGASGGGPRAADLSDLASAIEGTVVLPDDPGYNLPRLREIKSRWDPDDLFSYAQSIPPAG